MLLILVAQYSNLRKMEGRGWGFTGSWWGEENSS